MNLIHLWCLFSQFHSKTLHKCTEGWTKPEVSFNYAIDPPWLEREFTDRKVRGSNPTSASQLPRSRFGQPGSIPALVLPSGGMAAAHRKGVTAER
ncbi:hypothetical protein CSKR_110774 [Clonorchis sinensis]|uniref:Uncharacterized protein n=1 Tax=Clonorchis sinensis TaxID=79923 RepID=A0A419Q1Z1_CLOSI|nr:hypothetical protein CSKR_110774 [Clonorchis sinensis]